jgi:hypothetical protein
MTEQASLTEQIIRPSVEEIHASIPHKGVRDLLNDAKNIQSHMNRELEDVETDEDLNPGANQRRAQEVGTLKVTSCPRRTAWPLRTSRTRKKGIYR